MDNLTPSLNDAQIKQNIDALQKQGVANDKIQAYVNNYQKDTTGNYVLKTSQQNAPTSSVATPQESLSSKIFRNLSENPISIVGKSLSALGNSGLFAGKQVGDAIGTLGGLGVTAGKEALGLVPKGTTSLYDTSAPSPTQVLGDVAKGAATVTGLNAPVPTTILGNIAAGFGLGALAGGGEAATKTSGSAMPTQEDKKTITKGALTGGITGGIVSGATSLLGHVIQSVGDKIQISAIKPSQADIKDGFSLDTIKEHGLGGSLSEVYNKTQSKLEDLSNQLSTKLQSSNSTVNLNDTYEDTLKSLVGNKAKSFGSNTSIENALGWLKNEISAVSESGEVTIPEAQQIKQATGKYGAWQFGAKDPEATAREAVANAFYDKLKTAIENGSPEGVKEINKQISKLIPVSNAVIRRIPVAERNSALSLTDMMALTASILNPHALVGLGISVAQKEGSIGNLLSKLGSAVPKIAPAASAASGAISGGVSAAPQAIQP